MFLGNNPISWSAKKQSTVSRSSTEAEYHALASTATKLSWFHTLSKELRVFLHHIPVIWCDNVSTIALGFVSSQDNFADIFTKPLLVPLFQFHCAKLLVDSSPISLRGDVEHSSSSRPVKKTKKVVCEENARFHFT